MNTRLKIMWLGLVCLALSWLVPPWETIPKRGYPSRFLFYNALFLPSPHWDRVGIQIAWPRLLLADAVIVALTAGAIATAGKRD